MPTLLEQSKTHPPQRGIGRSGQDSWEFDVPTGQQLAGAELVIEEAGADCGARIGRAPSAGAAGHGRVDINWWYSTGNAVRYRIKVTTEPAEREATVSETGWRAHHTKLLSLRGLTGTDEFRIEVPSGHSLAEMELVFVHRRRGGAAFRAKPAAGSTGSLRVLVDWRVDGWGGRVEYFIRATFAALGPVAFTGSTPVFMPDPIVAGASCTLAVGLTNVGTTAISKFTLHATFRANILTDPLANEYLRHATEEQRTMRIPRTVELEPPFEPGTQRPIAHTETFPLGAIPIVVRGVTLAPTTRGSYTVFVGVEAFTPNNPDVRRISVFVADPIDITVV